MGNRAIIHTQGEPSVGIYLHWNGGPESVLAFLEAAKQLGVRDAGDSQYFLARFGQIISNFFGGTTSVGFGLTANMDDGDNGRYSIGDDFKIVAQENDLPMTVAALDADDRKRYDGVLAECLLRNREPFARGS